MKNIRGKKDNWSDILRTWTAWDGGLPATERFPVLISGSAFLAIIFRFFSSCCSRLFFRNVMILSSLYKWGRMCSSNR
jgi:hypothetical protein